MPVVRVPNIVSTIEELKQKGLWIFCADMDGQPWCSTDMGGPIGIVVGAEGSGVSRLTKEHLDYVIAAVKALYEDRESIPNMRIVWGTNLPMRHFHAFLEPYPNT